MGVLLATHTADNVNISTLAEVLNFTYVGDTPASVLVRMTVGAPGGAGSAGIAGGTYIPRIFVNDLEIVPTVAVDVEPGALGFIVQTNPGILMPNDQVSLFVLGQESDVAVQCTSIIFDENQLSANDIINISTALSHVQIRPERVILGPCKQPVKTFLKPK